MRKILLLAACLCCSIFIFSPQSFGQKKPLSHEDLVTWKQIESPRISNDGNWVAYSLQAEEGDATLHLWSATSGETTTFERGKDAEFSDDSRFLVFKITPFEDSLKAQRRRKVDKEELPRDSLGILRLADLTLEKVPDLKSFQLPEKWSGWLVFQKQPEREAKEKPQVDTTAAAVDSTLATAPPDTAKAEVAKPKKPKKESKKNGSKLIVRDFASGEERTLPFVLGYQLAKEAPGLVFSSTGNDSTLFEGVYQFNFADRTLDTLLRAKGEFKQLTINDLATQVAFLANLDTTKAQVPPYGLFHWRKGTLPPAEIIADTGSFFLPENWLLSENARPEFSEDGSKLYFGIAPPPILQDTNLLDEEIVNVEVWSYTDGRLHTQQKVRLDNERKRSYRVVYHVDPSSQAPAKKRYAVLGSETFPETNLGNEGNARLALAYTEEEYLQLISWEGATRKNVVLIDTETGQQNEVAKALHGNPGFSPAAKFVQWFSYPDSNWVAYSVADGQSRNLTASLPTFFYNEENDVPDHPDPYGIAAWTKDDRKVLVYDRYDLWQIDPLGKEAAVNLTNGRASNLRFRYIRLDPEERFVEPGQRLLLHVFNEKTKASGFAYLMLGAGGPIQLVLEDFDYNYPRKARDSDRLIFTKENFQTFPDLLYTDLSLQKPRRVSNANPQQAEYRWGSIELVEWTALDGQRLTGMLVKPEGFDPAKQYPMLVNFYEKSSDRLHSYPRPYPGRSTINYSFYASRGYLIFNPDVPYRIGYPGESAENSVLPGVASLIDRGFVNRERIGVQGHSWGGYQVAHLLTRTDLFRCAESGAPVVNMFSAYGGIRWGTGLSRMFQYERTQSRIGGTIWEYPLRYLENSPIFFLDKVNTPVLILHNDQDGAVPWYQGIEYFVGLRRLGKPAWLLNYNDEPHWPVKLQNRKDFQLRMSQFFDHYLMDGPLPVWMERGVPAVETGIRQGLETRE